MGGRDAGDHNDASHDYESGNDNTTDQHKARLPGLTPVGE